MSYTLQGGCIALCSWQQQWKGTLTMPMAVGDIGTVTITNNLNMSLVAYPLLGQVGSGSAYADPYIYYVHPTTPNAGQYSIAVSQGIGNVPLGSTPEPSSLMLLGSGLVGLVGVISRKTNS